MHSRICLYSFQCTPPDSVPESRSAGVASLGNHEVRSPERSSQNFYSRMLNLASICNPQGPRNYQCILSHTYATLALRNNVVMKGNRVDERRFLPRNVGRIAWKTWPGRRRNNTWSGATAITRPHWKAAGKRALYDPLNTGVGRGKRAMLGAEPTAIAMRTDLLLLALLNQASLLLLQYIMLVPRYLR